MTANRKFPALPAFQANWAPIYLEPIAGSGERITVAITAIGSDGEFRVHPTLREDALRCFLGDHASSLLSICHLCTQNLERYLGERLPLNEWKPPLGGFSLGEMQKTNAPDITAAVRMAIADSAFLCALPDQLGIELEAQIAASEADNDRWPSQVQTAVSHKVPALVQYFGRRFQVASQARQTPIDFVGQKLVVNLARLLPGRGLAQHIRTAKVKLWDLDAVRTMAEAPSLFQGGLPQFELLLYHPRDDDPAYSDREITGLHEALSELEEVGDRHELRVQAVFSADEAADRIIHSEAA